MQDDLLRSVSRSFYLSLRFLPGPMRPPVSLAYLLARYGDTLADAPGLPRETRSAALWDLQRAVEGAGGSLADPVLAGALDHPGERHLLRCGEEILASYRALEPSLRGLVAEVLAHILAGQRWDVQAFVEGPVACDRAEALWRYTYQVAGSVGEFWTKIAYEVLGERFADADEAEAMLHWGRQMGQALQLVNILRDLHEDLPRGRCYLPADELRAAGWSGEGMPSLPSLIPVCEHWLAQARGLLEASESYGRRVRDPRLRFATRLPHLLADKTLDVLEAAGAEESIRQRLKVTRGALWRSVLWAAVC